MQKNVVKGTMNYVAASGFARSRTAIESILMHPTKGAHEPHLYFNNMLLRSAVTLVVGILEYECLVIRIRRASAAPLWGAMMKDGG